MSAFGNNLRKYREAHGLTQAELAELLGTSKQVVSRYENGQRSPKISVVSHFAAALGMTIAELSSEEKLPDVPQLVPVDGMTQIPIIGSLRCGRGGLAMQVIEGTRLAANVKAPGEYVYFHVDGDSMEPLTTEGDYALIRKQDMVESGEIAAVCIETDDGPYMEGMLKKVKIEPTRVTLISLNSKYDPIVFDHEDMNKVRIVGKVVRIEKDL